jgi:hypothetical protein
MAEDILINTDPLNSTDVTPPSGDPEGNVVLFFLEQATAIQEQEHKELEEVRTRGDQISIVHKAIKLVNANTNDEGELDAHQLSVDIEALKNHYTNDEEIKKNPKRQAILLQEIERVGASIKEMTKGKKSCSKSVRDKLNDLFNMDIKEFQAITRLSSTRQDALQAVKNVTKPHDEAKRRVAGNLK